MQRRGFGGAVSACVCVVLTIGLMPPPAAAQNRFVRAAIKTAVCGGGLWGGYHLGDKVADAVIARMKVAGDQVEKVRRSFQIGVAAALCGTGVLLTGTIFNSLSERDRKAREREMAAALADATPGTRTYVLPDSQLMGRLETEQAVQDGDKQCRQQVDFIAGANEPAAARWCRKNANDKYELELGV
jgi:surface antigen